MRRKLLRRFVNWMENGPSILTIFFLPLLLFVWLTARLISLLKSINE